MTFMTPDILNQYDDNQLKEYILSMKEKLQGKIVIPAHHYQRQEITEMADFIGDSYKLAVECSKVKSQFIIFCGVMFMAEGAEVLADKNQRVLIPNKFAGCPMADMIDIDLLKKSFDMIQSKIDKELIPIVYMNSYADVKSFCGEKGGSVCTSSNAKKIIEYYLNQDKAIFFFPDYHLGKNTANKMGLTQDEVTRVKKDLTITKSDNIDKIKIFLWDGFCHVHQNFTTGDVKSLRKEYPNIKIIVHPECDESVVNISDMAGSTQQIYNEVVNSPKGSVWGIGTELNFVKRLSIENKDKTIVPLRESICYNMAKITLKDLAQSILSVEDFLQRKGKLQYPISVNNEYKVNSQKALKKMIYIVEN